MKALYTAEDVRNMLEGAWRTGCYDAGYTHDNSCSEKKAAAYADEFLGPKVEAATDS